MQFYFDHSDKGILTKCREVLLTKKVTWPTVVACFIGALQMKGGKSRPTSKKKITGGGGGHTGDC